MNTQDKASELVLKFTPYMYCYRGSGMLSNEYDEKVVLDFAKWCAITTVEETLKALKVPPIENKGHALYDSQIDYWNEVKELIEVVSCKYTRQ